jgi:hypothetical protein
MKFQEQYALLSKQSEMMLEKFSVPQKNFNWLSISNKLQDYITQHYITVSQKGSSKTYFSV